MCKGKAQMQVYRRSRLPRLDAIPPDDLAYIIIPLTLDNISDKLPADRGVTGTHL
jgi:hypothetical protein